MEVRAAAWSQDDSGRDLYQPTGDLIVYPPLLEIKGGEARSVRIGYVGTADPHRERTYRIFFQEIPEKVEADATLKVTIQLGVPAFVPPAKGKVKPDWVLLPPEYEQGLVRVKFTNRGNGHVLFQDHVVKGLGESGEVVFSADRKGWYLLPGASAVLAFPVPESDCRKIHKYEATFSTDRERKSSSSIFVPDKCVSPPAPPAKKPLQ